MFIGANILDSPGSTLCLRFNLVSLFQLTSRDSELDSVKDRYNAALKDVGATFGLDVLSGICVCLGFACCSRFFFRQYLHAPSEERYI